MYTVHSQWILNYFTVHYSECVKIQKHKLIKTEYCTIFWCKLKVQNTPICPFNQNTEYLQVVFYFIRKTIAYNDMMYASMSKHSVFTAKCSSKVETWAV